MLLRGCHERYQKHCTLRIAIIFIKIAQSLRLCPTKRDFVYQFWSDVGYSQIHRYISMTECVFRATSSILQIRISINPTIQPLTECEDLDDIRAKLSSSANFVSNKLRRGPIANRNTRMVPRTSGKHRRLRERVPPPRNYIDSIRKSPTPKEEV